MMQTTWFNLLLIAAGGGFGAVCRYLAASAVNDWGSDFKPLGTMAVNIVGCFLVGLVMHLLVRAEATGSPGYYLLVTGVLGGFTTFSAFGYETLVLMQKRQQTDVLLNLGGNLGCGLLAVYLGQRTGAALWP